MTTKQMDKAIMNLGIATDVEDGAIHLNPNVAMEGEHIIVYVIPGCRSQVVVERGEGCTIHQFSTVKEGISILIPLLRYKIRTA